MKAVLVTLMMLLIFGSACQKHYRKSFEKMNNRETIEKSVLMDTALSKVVSHPLMCVEGGDFPNGDEMILRKKNGDRRWIHAIFPEEVKAPDKMGVEIVLTGFFQKIQKRDRFTPKRPPEDYQYFVVISWEKQE